MKDGCSRLLNVQQQPFPEDEGDEWTSYPEGRPLNEEERRVFALMVESVRKEEHNNVPLDGWLPSSKVMESALETLMVFRERSSGGGRTIYFQPGERKPNTQEVLAIGIATGFRVGLFYNFEHNEFDRMEFAPSPISKLVHPADPSPTSTI